jgi:hypothetical protein
MERFGETISSLTITGALAEIQKGDLPNTKHIANHSTASLSRVVERSFSVPVLSIEFRRDTELCILCTIIPFSSK